MDMSKALEDGAIQNIFIALVVAYFILLVFTGNFLVPLAAVLSIGSTITWVFASVLLVGYKFDVVMSILVVMIVGMSVDYAARELSPRATAPQTGPRNPTRAPSCCLRALADLVRESLHDSSQPRPTTDPRKPTSAVYRGVDLIKLVSLGPQIFTTKWVAVATRRCRARFTAWVSL